MFTSLAFGTLDDQRDREFSFARKPEADACLHFEELDLNLIDQAKVFCFGSLSLTGEAAKAPVEDLDDARTVMLWGLHQADFVKISDEEVEFLWGCDEKEAGKKLLPTCPQKSLVVFLQLWNTKPSWAPCNCVLMPFLIRRILASKMGKP